MSKAGRLTNDDSIDPLLDAAGRLFRGRPKCCPNGGSSRQISALCIVTYHQPFSTYTPVCVFTPSSSLCEIAEEEKNQVCIRAMAQRWRRVSAPARLTPTSRSWSLPLFLPCPLQTTSRATDPLGRSGFARSQMLFSSFLVLSRLKRLLWNGESSNGTANFLNSSIDRCPHLRPIDAWPCEFYGRVRCSTSPITVLPLRAGPLRLPVWVTFKPCLAVVAHDGFSHTTGPALQKKRGG